MVSAVSLRLNHSPGLTNLWPLVTFFFYCVGMTSKDQGNIWERVVTQPLEREGMVCSSWSQKPKFQNSQSNESSGMAPDGETPTRKFKETSVTLFLKSKVAALCINSERAVHSSFYQPVNLVLCHSISQRHNIVKLPSVDMLWSCLHVLTISVFLSAGIS